jgi:diguanylate cyclase (GGDEF)-like protein/PAS domain S-box-containing protein
VRTIRLSSVNSIAWILQALAIPLLVAGAYGLKASTTAAQGAAELERNTILLGWRMNQASDYLTDQVRSFVVTGKLENLDSFWAEIEQARRRENVLLEGGFLGIARAEQEALQTAKGESDSLVGRELRAMRLAAEAWAFPAAGLPRQVAGRALGAEDEALPAAGKLDLARELVFGVGYWEHKQKIRDAVRSFTELSMTRSAAATQAAKGDAERVFALMAALCLLAFAGQTALLFLYYRLVSIPIRGYMRELDAHDAEAGYPPLVPKGGRELVSLAERINEGHEVRLLAERALRDSELKLRTHMYLMPLAAIEIDVANRISAWNPAAESIFGFRREEAMGRDVLDLIVPERLKTEIGSLIARINRGERIERNVNVNLRKDGREIVCEWYNSPLSDSLGRVVGWASLVKDITEERAEAERVLYLSRHDPLTGLLNRRSLQERFEAERLRSRRSGSPYSAIMLDIDGFKRFNDEHGHECGDVVLREAARAMAGSARATDSVGRWGGEEFLVLLPETALAGALELAEKIRSRIESLDVAYGGESLRVTMTAGAAESRGPEESADGCIRRADEALLAGKAAGRNRVEGSA